jgi:DNA processing protein
MVSEPTKRLLRLSCLPGVGAVTLRKVILQDPSRLFAEGDDEELLRGLMRASSPRGKQDPLAWVRTLESCAAQDFHLLSPLDDAYPIALRSIDDFPPLLYLRGRIDGLSEVGCAVVGTREASPLGLSWARQIAEVLAARGYSIVSGLALGIDTAAHTGALRANGTTVAVMAHGLDQVTPSSNRQLAEEIVSSGGLLISEHPPGTPPRKPEYVRRNRIQSGMSVCSIVVESGETGGAIHQGNFTLMQRRLLFCVVPNRDVPGADQFKFGGSEILLAKPGTRAIRSRDDLLQIIEDGVLVSEWRKWSSLGA